MQWEGEVNRVKIIFKKGNQKSDLLTIIRPDNSHTDLESARLESGLSLCVLQYVAEEVFGLVGPIRMLAAGIDLDGAATAFARTKLKILCLALEDQMALPDTDIIRFHKRVSELCKVNHQPEFLLERAAVAEALHRLRQMRLLVEKLGTGGTFNMSLDI
jgi:hypothetical protein